MHAANPPADDNAPGEYQDKLIDGGMLEESRSTTDTPQANAQGNFRSFDAELSGSVISPRVRNGGTNSPVPNNEQAEFGISLKGRYHTGNYGLLGIDAELRRGTGFGLGSDQNAYKTNGLVRVSMVGAPLGNGWLADAAIGATASGAIALLRRQPRFHLPTSQLQGLSLSLKGYPRLAGTIAADTIEPRMSINFAIGEPGLLGGMRFANFTGLSGIELNGGAQFNLDNRIAIGIQAIAIANARDPYAVILDEAANAKRDAFGILATAGYDAGRLRIQVNGLFSNSKGQPYGVPGENADTSGQGAWADVTFRAGRTAHAGGVYYFAPNLTWGLASVMSSAYGGYYRVSSSSQRWRWNLSLDGVKGIGALGASGFIANGDLRRQLTFTTSIGANSTIRVANGRFASQFLGYVDFQNGLGATRIEAGWSHDALTDLYRISWNQNWQPPAWLPSGFRLTSQVGFDHRRTIESQDGTGSARPSTRANAVNVAIGLGASPFSGISLDASLAYNADFRTGGLGGMVPPITGALDVLSSQQGRNFSANLVALARLSSTWSLSANFVTTNTSLSQQYSLAGLPYSPLGPTADQLAALQKSRFTLTAGYLTLRYGISAGQKPGAIGKRDYPVGGTGTLSGRVYLDENGNGVREPTEKGVPGIIVVIDGVFATRTDAAGYYRFEDLADGKHKVTVVADNLPLPWFIESEDSSGAATEFMTIIDIRVRRVSDLDIAARR